VNGSFDTIQFFGNFDEAVGSHDFVQGHRTSDFVIGTDESGSGFGGGDFFADGFGYYSDFFGY